MVEGGGEDGGEGEGACRIMYIGVQGGKGGGRGGKEGEGREISDFLRYSGVPYDIP